jgi:hypothetical protein
MQPIHVLMTVIGLAAAIAVGLFASTRIAAKRRMRNVHALLAAVLPGAVLSNEDGWTKAETGVARYLLKTIPFGRTQELILTNRYFWCVNSDLGNWRRSTVPELVPGVRAFVDRPADPDGKLVKIALLYPGCRNVTRYLNESDVEIVLPRKSVDGIHFVSFEELPSFLSEREKK